MKSCNIFVDALYYIYILDVNVLLATYATFVCGESIEKCAGLLAMCLVISFHRFWPNSLVNGLLMYEFLLATTYYGKAIFCWTDENISYAFGYVEDRIGVESYVADARTEEIRCKQLARVI